MTCSSGYDKTLLSNSAEEVRKINRQDLLSENYKEKKQNKQRRENNRFVSKPTMVLAYSPQFNLIKNIVCKYLPILHQNPKLKSIVKEGINVTPRKAKNLKSLLHTNSTSFNNPIWFRQPGFVRCHKPRCVSCRWCGNGRVFHDDRTNKDYRINEHIMCDSTFVVYTITCTICKLTYVGSTIRMFKIRLGEHISDITHKREHRSLSNLSRHFLDVHKGDLTGLKAIPVQMISGGNNKEDRVRKCEVSWMLKIDSFWPQGLNVRKDLLYYY